MTAPERPDPDDETPEATRIAAVAEIDAALGRLRRSMARRSLGRRVLDELGLAIEPAVVEVVDIIAESDVTEPAGVAIGTVAARLDVDPSQASRLVAECVRAGMVERLASQDDGRRSVLKLTPAGRDIIASTQRQKRALLLGHVADWSDDELAGFARSLSRFATLARG
ncbi:MarR family transcriptional regulator [Mesorhizobium sp. BR1-1-16]|uniref:MarR family winged helix-turn-helix transcriptional regulator n=1 Tax=Mesorhizobium sp. BR1-1-16 TaxID=2876653 RepID=UPI001CC97DC1|nr:MarR family transcriptional regulator [Mesorhizobium sp. BR1-1-16]MBZ9936451.1 MarR family transcriptional regulator [Mesorhizobium sp. BR1-1-16]